MRGLVALLLAVGAVACTGTPPASEAPSGSPTLTPPPAATRELSGSLTVYVQSVDDFEIDADGRCAGQGRFAHLGAGAEVAVRGPDDALIALGRLRAGTMDWDALACRMRFGPIAVPASDFYSLAFGEREGPTFAQAELEAAGWTVDASVGEPMSP